MAMTSEPMATPDHDSAVPGFAPGNTPRDNTRALQAAVDRGGRVVVTRPGVYDVGNTVLVGSRSAVEFAPGVVLRKVADPEPFTHVLLNRGAVTGQTDEDITVRGLHVAVNGVDHRFREVYGLRGQLALFRVRRAHIDGFTCLDLGPQQFALHVCTFEDLLVENVHIVGRKDGVHLGRGRRFLIRRGTFQTHDDAVALNAHDYAKSNPELGWIEDGVVEHCHDLPHSDRPTGFFCRILAGSWGPWRAGMELQHSDSVVHAGRVYRVHAEPDGRTYVSHTPPTHEHGTVEHEGIRWAMVQPDGETGAGVRNVTLENVRVLHDAAHPLVRLNTPVDVLTVAGGVLRRNPVRLDRCQGGGATPVVVNLRGCTWDADGPTPVLEVAEGHAQATVRASGCVATGAAFEPVFGGAGAGAGVTVTGEWPGR